MEEDVQAHAQVRTHFIMKYIFMKIPLWDRSTIAVAVENGPEEICLK